MKKIKKTMAVVLCAAMILGLTACGAEPATAFFDTFEDLSSIRETDFETTIDVVIPKELSKNFILNSIGMSATDLEEDIHITVKTDGTLSLSQKKVEANIEYMYESENYEKLTSIIIDENNIYIDMLPLVGVLSKIPGIDANEIATAKEQLEDYLDGRYISIPLNEAVELSGMNGEEIDFWDMATKSDEGADENQTELVNMFTNELKVIAKENKIITKEKNNYTLNVNNENFELIFTNMMDFMEENIDDIYTKLERISESNEGIEMTSKEEFLSQLNEMCEQISNIEMPSFNVNISIGYDKKANMFDCKTYIHIEDTFKFTEESKLLKGVASTVEIPDSIPYEEFQNKANIMGDMNEENISIDDPISSMEPSLERADVESNIKTSDTKGQTGESIINDVNLIATVRNDAPVIVYSDISTAEFNAKAQEFIQIVKDNIKGICDSSESVENLDNEYRIRLEKMYDNSYISKITVASTILQDTLGTYRSFRVAATVTPETLDKVVQDYVNVMDSLGYSIDASSLTKVLTYTLENADTLKSMDGYAKNSGMPDSDFYISVYPADDFIKEPYVSFAFNHSSY